MNSFYKIIITVICLSILFSSQAKSSVNKQAINYVKSKYALPLLVKLKEDRQKMIEEFEHEDRSYNAIKKAIRLETLKRGKPASEIEEEYGKPVISLTDDNGNSFKWVYKPSTVSYFLGPKIYLTFDNNKRLISWE